MPGDKVYREIYHCENHSKSYRLLNTAWNLTQNVDFHIFFQKARKWYGEGKEEHELFQVEKGNYRIISSS